MERFDSLNDLLMEEMAQLLNAEDQLVKALPKIAQDSESSGVKSAVEEYWEITREHINRLRDIFSHIGQHPQAVTCGAMKGFITEIEDVVNRIDKSQDRDAATIWVMQRVGQYEIAEYKKAREHAADLDHTKMVEVFTKTLNEQRAMNFHFNELAQGMINVQTTGTKSAGFYIPEGKFRRRGVKKKTRSMDVSRFISEGNPNIQEPQEKGEEKKDQDLKNPEEQGGYS